MQASHNTFKVLDTLDRNQITTQRQLAHHSGVSLGQVNYVLKHLLAKGWVTLGNIRKDPRKIRYTYLLTPAGIQAKSSLAIRFIVSKLKEYRQVRRTLVDKLMQMEKPFDQRVVFVGPRIIFDVLDSVIQENKLKFDLVDFCETLQNLNGFSSNSYDMAILGNGNSEDVDKIQKINSTKPIVHLW